MATITKKELLSLPGSLNFAMRIIPQGRSFSRLSDYSKSIAHVRMNTDLCILVVNNGNIMLKILQAGGGSILSLPRIKIIQQSVGCVMGPQTCPLTAWANSWENLHLNLHLSTAFEHYVQLELKEILATQTQPWVNFGMCMTLFNRILWFHLDTDFFGGVFF